MDAGVYVYPCMHTLGLNVVICTCVYTVCSRCSQYVLDVVTGMVKGADVLVSSSDIRWSEELMWMLRHKATGDKRHTAAGWVGRGCDVKVPTSSYKVEKKCGKV